MIQKDQINGPMLMLRWFYCSIVLHSLWSFKTELNRKPIQKRKWLLRDVLLTNDYIKFFRYEVDPIKLKTQNFFNESSERKMVSERWFSNSVSSDAYYETTFYRIYCKVKCPAITHSVYLLANKYTRVRKQPTSLLRQTARLPVWQNFKLEQYTARISCLACI